MSVFRMRSVLQAVGAGVALVGALSAGGCISVRGPEYDAEITRDLSDVAGCRFMTTVRAPRIRPRLEFGTYNDYLAEMRRRAVAAGGTHVYLLTDAASWGAVDAAGSVYRCS